MINNLENTSTATSVLVAIVGYSLCSSTLLLANKVHDIHFQIK